MGKLSDSTRKIDMYASLPSLSFGKDGKVYSRLGSLLTFLTIIIIGGMAIWIGIKIFGRHTPSFVQYDLPPQVSDPTIPFNLDDFKFGFTTYLGLSTEYTYLSYTATWRDPKGHNVPVTIDNDCYFKMTDGVDTTCFKQDESTIGKTYLDTRYSWYFKVQLDYCDSTVSGGCQTKADTKTFLQDNQQEAWFMYEDVFVDPYSYDNPVTVAETYTSETILLGVGTQLVVELNYIQFTSDNGWIFEDLKTETRLKPTITTKVSDSEMLGVRILYGGTTTVYKRTYPKLQDFFAQVSGFITIITPIFLILVSPYGNLQAIQHMVNELYEIKLNKPNNNDGDSPAAAKKKRLASKASRITPVKGLSKKAMATTSQNKASSPPGHSKSIPFAPHAAFIMGGIGKPITKEEIPPTPKEDTSPLHYGTSDRLASDQSTLISPEKVPIGHAKDFELEKVEDLEAQEEVLENNDDEGVSDCETDVPLRTSDPLEVPWQNWLRSFWRPNPEVQVLNKAKERLMEAFDLVTLAKKAIEIDKLKACLFTHDQRVIFENLPSSVIVLNPDIDLKSPEAIKQYHWKDSFKGDEVAVRKAYSRLQGTTNQLDQLLLRLYENEFIDDGASL